MSATKSATKSAANVAVEVLPALTAAGFAASADAITKSTWTRTTTATKHAVANARYDLHADTDLRNVLTFAYSTYAGLELAAALVAIKTAVGVLPYVSAVNIDLPEATLKAVREAVRTHAGFPASPGRAGTRSAAVIPSADALGLVLPTAVDDADDDAAK